MDFNLSEEQRLLRDSAQRYASELGAPGTPARTDDGAFPNARWQQMADMGWLGMLLPADAGGLGLSMVEAVMLMEQLGAGLVREPIVPTAILAATLFEQATEWPGRSQAMSAIAEGKLAVALAHEEAGDQELDASVTMRALPAAGGYRLIGAKSPVLWGGYADALIVSAVEEGARKPSLFFLRASTPGVERRVYPLIDGSQACDLLLRDAQVAAADRLFAPGAGEAALARALDRTTLALVAEALGTMEAVMKVSSEYIKTRVQFGQPLGKFQALQHIMADMFVEAQQLRSILYYALSLIDAQPAERARAVSAAKAMAGTAVRVVGYGGIQLHGANGMTEEYPVGHLFRRLVVFEKMFGDTETHFRRFIALGTQ